MAYPPREPVPADVTDVLLWRLAVDVAAAHQPDPHDPNRCVHLRCKGEVYPCPPALDADLAHRAATRPTDRGGPVRGPGWIARGRARVVEPVAAAASRFTGWFRPTRPNPTPTVTPAVWLPVRTPTHTRYAA